MFFISSLFIFLANNFIPKNNAKNIKAKMNGGICVKTIAESDIAIIRYDFFRFRLIMLQRNRIRKDCDNIEGQCPHKNPVEEGNEKIINDRGKESKATVLLKFLIMKYMIKLAIIAKNTTIK
tara:strand:+ start:2598 stop:2963 length:366 start_codon:yes stop_codon:yes gene_type:complete